MVSRTTARRRCHCILSILSAMSASIPSTTFPRRPAGGSQRTGEGQTGRGRYVRRLVRRQGTGAARRPADPQYARHMADHIIQRVAVVDPDKDISGHQMVDFAPPLSAGADRAFLLWRKGVDALALDEDTASSSDPVRTCSTYQCLIASPPLFPPRSRPSAACTAQGVQ